MTKSEIREKCERLGVVYLGYWEGTHWAMKENVKGLPYHGGMIYVLNKDFFIK